MRPEPLRLCEHQAAHVSWPRDTREALQAAARDWSETHRLPDLPLSFEGTDGCLLRARQYVGVVEAGGVCVEIYPKLDSELIRDERRVNERRGAVMHQLLWLLEVSGFGELVDAGDAGVAEVPDSISDLLAWLFAKRLSEQLALGLPQEYVGRQDDLPLVRGRIEFARQATVLFGRPDVIACAWDEFTPDTALARSLRCATETLMSRARLPGAAASLSECLAMLGDVPCTTPFAALHEGERIRWSRLNSRWRKCHDLAAAVLRGLGRGIQAGGTESFVFLLDMNRVFESHCARWIERRFGVRVNEQARLGHLLVSPDRKLGQDADFVWKSRGEGWLGDAKYKLGMQEAGPRIEDVRQVVCYGLLAGKRFGEPFENLMILHPTTEDEEWTDHTTFAGQRLRLQTVRVVNADPSRR